jgi:hypothetical protein
MGRYLDLLDSRVSRRDPENCDKSDISHKSKDTGRLRSLLSLMSPPSNETGAALALVPGHVTTEAQSYTETGRAGVGIADPAAAPSRLSQNDRDKLRDALAELVAARQLLEPGPDVSD